MLQYHPNPRLHACQESRTYTRDTARERSQVSAHIFVRGSATDARDMCTHMLACRRARWMHSVAWKHVFTSRVVVTFRLGAVIAEARLENRPETMDRRQNFTKGRRGRAHRWRQQRECVHFGAADIDHPLFSVWFCCNIARTFVPDFRGIACNQRTDASEHGASFSLLFFTGLFFFLFRRDRGRAFARVENTRRRAAALNFIWQIVFRLSSRFGASRNPDIRA